MLTVDLLRHGALVGGVKYRGHVNDPLTTEGEASMQAVWSHLHNNIDCIISSPLSRCAEPATAWAHEKGIPCIMEPRIQEMFYGAWEGLDAEQIEAAYPGMLATWRANPEGMTPPGGGETPEALRKRIADWWQHACAQYDGAHLLVVGHSGSLRMLISYILSAPIITTRQLQMPYACWSRIQHHQGKNTLLFHNAPITPMLTEK